MPASPTPSRSTRPLLPSGGRSGEVHVIDAGAEHRTNADETDTDRAAPAEPRRTPT